MLRMFVCIRKVSDVFSKMSLFFFLISSDIKQIFGRIACAKLKCKCTIEYTRLSSETP